MPASTDPAKAARQRANLLRGPSADPTAASRSAANLRRGNPSHGAHAGARLAELRDEHDAALLRDYPEFDPRRRRLLADRLARIEAASDWTGDQGLMSTAKGKRGDVWPVVAHLERWASRAEDMLAQAEREHREAKDGKGDTLASIAQELAAGAADGDPAADDPVEAHEPTIDGTADAGAGVPESSPSPDVRPGALAITQTASGGDT